MKNNVLLAITGSVAAYKAVELLRLLRKAGKDVKVVLTKSGEKFITPLSFLSLGASAVFTDNNQFDVDEKGVSIHLSLSRWADCIVVAPASANTIAKIREGIADNLLLTIILASKKPVFIAPCMNENMLENPATQENITTLKKRGVFIIEPEIGPLADLQIGKGRMPDPSKIYEEIIDFLDGDNTFSGKRILVTAGATKEFIDPVRFITNASSGKTGIEIAKAAKRMGGEVHLIYGDVSVPLPRVHRYTSITTTEELLQATQEAFKECDILIMTAAPADFKPLEMSNTKLPKVPTLTMELVETPDILKEVSKGKDKKILVGFALQTEDIERNAVRKMEEKNLDIIVANRETNIGEDTGDYIILTRNHKKKVFENISKENFAKELLLFIKELINGG